MIEPTYIYRATLVKVIDGDTARLKVDVGFHVEVTDSFRLSGIDCPELRTPEGKAARDAAAAWWAANPTVRVRTFKAPEKYGRWLALVDGSEGTLNEWLVAEGHARPYDGGAR